MQGYELYSSLHEDCVHVTAANQKSKLTTVLHNSHPKLCLGRDVLNAAVACHSFP